MHAAIAITLSHDEAWELIRDLRSHWDDGGEHSRPVRAFLQVLCDATGVDDPYDC